MLAALQPQSVSQPLAIFSQITSPNITFSVDRPLSGKDSAAGLHICDPATQPLALRDTRAENTARTIPTMLRYSEGGSVGAETLPSSQTARPFPPVAQRESNGAGRHLRPRCGRRQFYDVWHLRSPTPPRPPPIVRVGLAVYSSVRTIARCPTRGAASTFLVQARTHVSSFVSWHGCGISTGIARRLSPGGQSASTPPVHPLVRRPTPNSLDTDAFVHQPRSPSPGVAAAVPWSLSLCVGVSATKRRTKYFCRPRRTAVQQLHTAFMSLFHDL